MGIDHESDADVTFTYWEDGRRRTATVSGETTSWARRSW
jgi:hypothetical protein